MKKFIYTFAALFSLVAMSSCSGDLLNTEPTDSMSGTTLLSDGERALVPLNGIYRSMYTAGWSTTNNVHQCFGISAYNLMAEVMGDDYVMGAQGAGWFWFDAAYNVKGRFASSAWRSYDLWNAYYTWISNANYIIGAEETMGGNEKAKKYALGQAYAIRAYSYFMLAQSFARTLKGHESEPCVPLMTEPTFVGTTGKARSTVAEVYAQIDKDIDKAVSLLEGTTQIHPSHIGYAVALGIKARICLVEENWAAAAAAADKAIKASGKSILPVEDFVGLNDVTKKNVMWGAEIIPDQTGGYASFFAMVDTVVSYGKNAPKMITKSLYNKIPTSDARKAWFDIYSNYTINGKGGVQQKKFWFKDAAQWTGDYIWMRVEEMYLIAAEAECHQGGAHEAAAKNYLMALMAKRDPKYSTNKTGTALAKVTNEETGSLLEEIILQRRIELWGEAGRIYDIRRLKQGFRRQSGDGWCNADALMANRPTDNPESFMWVLTIPQAEFDGNENMNIDKDQNPTGDLK